MFDFPYSIKNSARAKNLRISIDANGQVVIVKSRFIPKIMAIAFLKSKQQWVLSHLNKLSLQKSLNNHIYYRGRLYKTVFKLGFAKIIIHQPTITIFAADKKIAERFLLKHLKQQSKQKILQSLNKYAQIMQLKFNQVHFRDQKTRWGSCSTKSNLNFNWRLIMTPLSVLNYVVIHELAHLKHHDHSSKFWQLVEKYDPDFREHRRWLSKHQSQLISNIIDIF